MAAQYGDYATGGDFETAAELSPGTGGVIRHGLEKVAVYRDTDGKLHQCTAPALIRSEKC